MSVHVVNGYTGHHLVKSNPSRPATTANESRTSRDSATAQPLPYLLPVMTKPFKLRGEVARLPAWEEDILIAEDFTYLLHPGVFILLELLDFAPAASVHADQPFIPFAWAFLKPVSGPIGRPGHANALRPMPLRLQLHRWQKSVRPVAGQPAVWAQYLAAGRQPYSSTAYITVRPQPRPSELPVQFPHRPMAAHHAERGRLSYEKLAQATARINSGVVPLAGAQPSSASGAAAAASLGLPPRAGGPCRLPNVLLHALTGGAHGATAIAISHDGALLAVALAEDDYAMLAVHEVASGRQRMLIHAHPRTIHELVWSADGSRLISVSSDGTAKLWRTAASADEELPYDEPLTTLHHPSFVYAARMQPRGPMTSRAPLSGGDAARTLVLTGCNDCAIRLWDAEKMGDDGQVVAEVLQTATQHTARINCLAWPSETSAFSADAAGVVKQWELVAAGETPELRQVSSIEKRELEGIAINSIALHPNRRRLLLQTRQQQLLALDTRLQHFSARYLGHRCSGYHIRATYSPDGRFVLAGSEDGSWFVWAEESGELLLDGHHVGFSGPMLQLSWSLQHHVVAFCGYGPHNPVILYMYDQNAPPLNPNVDTLAPLPVVPVSAAATLTSSADGLSGATAGMRAGEPPPTGGGAEALSATDRAARRENRKAARANVRRNVPGAALAASADKASIAANLLGATKEFSKGGAALSASADATVSKVKPGINPAISRVGGFGEGYWPEE